MIISLEGDKLNTSGNECVRREWDYDSSALDQLVESTKCCFFFFWGGRLEAFNFLDNKSKSSMDERVRAVAASASGGVNGNAQGKEGMSNIMFSKLMNNNSLLQEECKGLKGELKV